MKPRDNDLPEWTARYPAGYREFLAEYGRDDEGAPLIRAFNAALMNHADHCQGKDHHVHEVLIEWLFEDWDDVLQGKSREVPANWAQIFAEAHDGAARLD